MRVRSHFRGFILIAAILFGSSHEIHAQDGPPIEERMMAALDAGEMTTVESLISENRLHVKPIVHKLISESLRAELSGEVNVARRKLEKATELAVRFESVFSERSLALAVGYVSAWSVEQKRQKVLADSLFAAGTDGRANQATVDQALEDYETSLSLYREIGDGIGEGSTLGGIGYIYFTTDLELTLQHNEQALEVRLAVDDKEAAGRALTNLGSIYYGQVYDFEKALGYYQRAERLRTEIGDLTGVGLTLNPMADTYRQLGRIEEAQATYIRSLSVNEEVGRMDRVTLSLFYLGDILNQRGRSSEALGYLEQALSIHEEREERWDIGYVQNLMGVAHYLLGDVESSIRNLQGAEAIAREFEDAILLADVYTNIGAVYLEAGRLQQAVDYQARALAQFEDLGDQLGISNTSINLGQSHFEMGDYASAETYASNALEASRETQDKLGEGTALTLLGNAQLYADKFEDAFESHEAALELGQSLGNPSLTFWAFLGFADNYERQGVIETAIEYYDKAFETVEGARSGLHSEQDRANFFSRQRYAYEQVVHFLSNAQVDDPGSRLGRIAFHYAERAKARSFLDLLAESLANVKKGISPEQLQREVDLLQKLSETRDELSYQASADVPDSEVLSGLRAQLDDLESDYLGLKRELRQSNPNYSALQYPQPSTLDDIQSDVLDEEIVLLEYAVGDSSTTLWAISKDSDSLYLLPGREQLKEQVDLLRFALTNPNQASPELFSNASHHLYQLLLEPAQEVIPEGKKLVIVPDGILNYVPFEALLTAEAGEGETFTSFQYLIRRHAISYGQSASVLQQLRANREGREHAEGKQFLAFGDPVYERERSEEKPSKIEFGGAELERLERLPFSGEEVQNIAKFFAPGQADVFLRGDATEEALKSIETLESYRYIHFATHGLIDDRKPDFSSVILARDAETVEDGSLQAAEIFNLRLNADLVVLSACETGLGRLVRGEGIVGLTRAFMYAGASSLVVSLWSVADQSTSKLMAYFYENMINREWGKTEALRMAKITLLRNEKYSHPFHWAPFVMIGDWE